MKCLPICLLVGALYLTAHCDSALEAVTEDDSNVNIEYADPSLLLNNIQLSSKSTFARASAYGGELTRMHFMYGSTYQNAFNGSSFDNIHSNAYTKVFIDTQTLLSNTSSDAFYNHFGVAKILKAYTMILMVDLFGDIPYSKSLDGTELNPPLQDDAFIYEEALKLLDEAIIDLENPVSLPGTETDLFFPNLSMSERIQAWKRVANTIKFKAYLNTREPEHINQLLSDGELILYHDHDFEFKYSTQQSNPDSRHPSFARNYMDNSWVFEMLANSYMNMLLTDKTFIDPRINYYIYRQDIAEDYLEDYFHSISPEHFDEDDPFCLLPYGYIGMDHLSSICIMYISHLPIATYGIYPAGGAFDEDKGGFADSHLGLQGAGIEPILLSAFTHFMIAEAELLLRNNPSNARASLQTALEHSFNKVADFGQPFAAGTPFEITDSTISAYQAVVLERFDAAPTSSEKMRVIAREYYFALWGNGYEAYNLMRRTGFPDRDDNLQPALTPSSGNWPRSVLYPASMVNRNDNVEQKTMDDMLQGPFWDPSKGSTKFNF